MFGFPFFYLFSKKTVDTKNVKEFDDVLDAIHIYMLVSEWEKAKKAIAEIKAKEEHSLNVLLTKFREENTEKTQEIRNNLIKESKIKFKKLENLKTDLLRREELYNEKINKQKLIIKFQKTKEEIVNLLGTKQSDVALILIKNILAENPNNPLVINFYNKQKKIIQKAIEKEKHTGENLVKLSTKEEALRLIGKIDEQTKTESLEKKISPPSFITKMKNKITFFTQVQKRLSNKKLLDEINILLEENSKVKESMIQEKLENIHQGLIKEISNSRLIGYDLYGKILGATKISGDTFGIHEGEKKYNFFLGDATGHGIRAGFIVTLLSNLFEQYSKRYSLVELAYEINNQLKQNLKSNNFITGIIFEVQKENISELNYVGMGHEPILVFRKGTGIVEKFIPGGLAAGIRAITNKENIKIKTIKLHDGDILITYSDGIVESKNENGEYYGIERLTTTFNKISIYESDIKKIYNYIIGDLQDFRKGGNFDDDVSIVLMKRNSEKDLMTEESEYLNAIANKEKLKRNEVKKLLGKTKEEIEKDLEELKTKRELDRIIKTLDTLYYTGEILKLKQEAIAFIKAGYVHKKINYYLKKALSNERKYKIEQKNIKIANKYQILRALLSKGDYDTVIREAEDIITKDGNI